MASKGPHFLISGFIGGVFVSSFFDFGWSATGLFLILTLVFSLLFWRETRLPTKSGQRLFTIVAMICLGLVLGLVRYSFFNNSAQKNIINNQSPIVGLITADPDRRNNTTRLTASLLRSSISPHGKQLFTGEKILVITDNFVDYKYGDKIEITGKIKSPKNFLTDTGKIFDYQNYLKVRGIERVSYYPKIKILARGQGSVIKASLFELKNFFLNNLRLVLPEPSATLAGGLILGDKGGLGDKVESEFRRAGISHIIVLSGYNITIVAENVLKFFAWFSPALSWLFGLVSIFLLVLMTGGEAAAVRSAVMGAIALIARRYGRQYDAGVALIVAGFLMVLWNPRLLVFDLGFQLSFLATLGMIYLTPYVSHLIREIFFLILKIMGRHDLIAYSLEKEPRLFIRDPKQHLEAIKFFSQFRELIATTTAAQLAVYPWILLQTGNATLIGFISNIFILPIVPFAMLASFVTGLTGFISYYVSLLASYPTYFFLTYILKLAHWFSLL